MADQSNFYKLPKDHAVDSVTDQLHVLDGVTRRRIRDWRVHRDVETVQLNHFLDAPDSELAVEGGGEEVGALSFNWS